MIEKPQILSDEQIKKANERVLSRHGIPCEPITVEDVIRIGNKLRLRIIEEQNIERLKAQLDAAVAYYEPLIQQAKAEVAREIKERLRLSLVKNYCRTERCQSTYCRLCYGTMNPLCQFLECIIGESLKSKLEEKW
jgi:hypothetical protein